MTYILLLNDKYESKIALSHLETHKQKLTELGFSQWALSDKPTMDDFNADNLLTDQLFKRQYSVTMKAVGDDKLNVTWNGSAARIGAD